MSGSTPGSLPSNARRPLYAAAAIIALLVIAVWTTTPAVVKMPAASVWVNCFEPAALPPASTEEFEAALVRHRSLEAPYLVAIVAEATSMRLEGWQPPRTADGTAAGQKVRLRAGQQIALPAGVTWTVALERGSAELRQADGSRFLVKSNARFSLHPAETYVAQLAVAVEVDAVAPDGRTQLPLGTRVEIILPDGNPTGEPVTIRRTQRPLVAPLVLPYTASALAPDVRPHRESAPYLATSIAAPGLDFDPTRRTLRACLWLGEGQPTPISISHVGTSTVGAAELVLGLPSEPFPWLDWRRGRMGTLVVADTSGRYTGAGQFVYPSRLWAFVIAMAITVTFFVCLLRVRNADGARKRWLMGLFLGDDGQPSLSLFQILLWTIVTVWALLFVFFSTGNLLAMTQQIMVLLGFAGAGSLAARWVASSRPSLPRRDGESGEARFWALLENERGFDLFKLQLFVFTLLIALYVIFRVVQRSAFPAIDAEFLLLMGVSNSLYVGSKVTQQSDPLVLAQQRKLEWDVLRLRTDDSEKAIAEQEAQSSDLAGRINATADPVMKQGLADQKAILDKHLVDLKAELAGVRADRDVKEAAYKEAVAALSKA